LPTRARSGAARFFLIVDAGCSGRLFRALFRALFPAVRRAVVRAVPWLLSGCSVAVLPLFLRGGSIAPTH
jgi:hypothetical protein